MTVTVKMKEINQLLREKGLTPDGSVQSFHTSNVLRRIIKYMPFRTGATIKATIAQTDVNTPLIITDVPYGQYVYRGVSRSGGALRYTKTQNPLAGPFWDRAIVAAEMGVMTEELQAYIDQRG